jgi:uroporphyrinogen-III synthase
MTNAERGTHLVPRSALVGERTMPRPLEGYTVALAEGRQLEELAQLLEQEGATTLRCPMVSILDAPDPAPVRAWLDDLVAGRFAWVVLMTGEAVRRLLALAARDGRREQVIAALGRTRTLTRGPKPGQALKEVGLTPTQIAPAPTTDGVIALLRNEPLRGQTIGVTLYGEANVPLVTFLEGQGAVARTVLSYVYAPAASADRVADLIGRLARGEVHVLLFTSSPQVDRLYEVARERGLEETLRQGMQRVRIAAVGPVVAENLRQHGARVDVCPEQGFVMKNLVRHIERALVPPGERGA